MFAEVLVVSLNPRHYPAFAAGSPFTSEVSFKCRILVGQIALCVASGGITTSVSTAALTIETAKQIL